MTKYLRSVSLEAIFNTPSKSNAAIYNTYIDCTVVYPDYLIHASTPPGVAIYISHPLLTIILFCCSWPGHKHWL